MKWRAKSQESAARTSRCCRLNRMLYGALFVYRFASSSGSLFCADETAAAAFVEDQRRPLSCVYDRTQLSVVSAAVAATSGFRLWFAVYRHRESNCVHTQPGIAKDEAKVKVKLSCSDRNSTAASAAAAGQSSPVHFAGVSAACATRCNSSAVATAASRATAGWPANASQSSSRKSGRKPNDRRHRRGPPQKILLRRVMCACGIWAHSTCVCLCLCTNVRWQYLKNGGVRQTSIASESFAAHTQLWTV